MTSRGSGDTVRQDPAQEHLRRLDKAFVALETLGAGAWFVKRTAVAATPYAVVSNDHVIEVDTSALAITVNLPAVAATRAGRQIIVKDSTGSAAARNITIDGNGGELINGSLTYVISANYGVIVLWSDGAKWLTR